MNRMECWQREVGTANNAMRMPRTDARMPRRAHARARPISAVRKPAVAIEPMNFKPLSNHLFLEPLEEEKTTKSGIVIPDTAEKEKPIKGTVLAVGPGKMLENGTVRPVAVKVGDTVLFKKYGPDEVEIDGKKYLVGDEEDILAVIE